MLSDSSLYTVKEEWGVHDHHEQGHGTAMAGLAAYGSLENHLASTEPIIIPYTLESAKILPPSDANETPKELWGEITQQGISIAEISAPMKKRVICMAVTAADEEGKGQPSSWSGAIDQITSGAEDEKQRLFLISAGNCASSTDNFRDLQNYPSHVELSPVQDPAQAWNALTIGSFTNLTTIEDETLKDYKPIAQAGEISPFSTTSFLWDKEWPIKPELVFEGGNLAVTEGKNGFLTECDDLSLLTTNHAPHKSQFTSFNMTSASTALAARFAASLQAAYPDYWPETIRALMVHSAQWPEAMQKQFAEDKPKHKVKKLLQACGYGVPDLERAHHCAKNRLTLISQQSIQPYKKEDKGNKYRSNRMHIFELPWPKEALLELGATLVTMRVTLSYFIEPSPGRRGETTRYRYPSHLLRFAMNHVDESRNKFEQRINRETEKIENGGEKTASDSKQWKIGDYRNKGSLHSDIWEGTAADLANHNLIAVYPAIGWWKERAHLGKGEKETRYALIVSIESPEQSVDIYTPVKLAIEASVATEVATPVLV